MEETPPKTECIFHESKFVFLSCAHVSEASVKTLFDASQKAKELAILMRRHAHSYDVSGPGTVMVSG